MNYFQKFKERWSVKSNYQLIVIFIVFAITGTLTVWEKEQLFLWMGIDPQSHFLIRFLLNITVVLIFYQINLIVVGTIFGQYKFFRLFLERTLGRLFGNNTSKE